MLELRRRGFTCECGVCAGLPAGWFGSEEEGGPLAWRRVARGLVFFLNQGRDLHFSTMESSVDRESGIQFSFPCQVSKEYQVSIWPHYCPVISQTAPVD
jgi:hypothetical protein